MLLLLGFQVFLNLNELALESAWLLVFGGLPSLGCFYLCGVWWLTVTIQISLTLFWSVVTRLGDSAHFDV